MGCQKIVSVENFYDWYLIYSSFYLDPSLKSSLHIGFKQVLEKGPYVSFFLNFSVCDTGLVSLIDGKSQRSSIASLNINPPLWSSGDRAKTRYSYDEGCTGVAFYQDDTQNEDGVTVFRLAQAVGDSCICCYRMASLKEKAARAFIRAQVLEVLSDLKSAYEAERVVQNGEHWLMMLNRLEGVRQEVVSIKM